MVEGRMMAPKTPPGQLVDEAQALCSWLHHLWFAAELRSAHEARLWRLYQRAKRRQRRRLAALVRALGGEPLTKE
jgi:hypothetical protein